MANVSLSDAFNDCVDRIIAGESLDACLQDYPEHAERLRALLQTGDLVSRAISNGADLSTAQAEGRARLQQRIEGRSHSSQSRSRFMLFGGLAAAAAAVVLVFGMLYMATSQPVSNVFSNIVSSLDPAYATTVAMNGLATREPVVVTALLMTTATPEPGMTIDPSATPFPEVMAAATLPFDPDLMATPIGLPPTASAIPTLMPFSTDPADGISPSDIPLNTPMSLPGTWTPVPLHAGPSATRAIGDSGIVATSVLSMSPVPMTTTPAAIAGQSTITATPSSTPTATVTALPTMTAPTTQIAQDGTQVALLTTHEPPPFQPSSLPPTLAPVQVIPLSAGEIDDNADWDTYLTYRQNYFRQSPAPVLDIDVTGRQIIRVSNDQGLPVLGAQVLVYAGNTLVSETRTTATGETLFFPNANPQYRGFQSFRVVVQREQEPNAITFTLEPSRGPLWDVALNDAIMDYDPINLDVVFLLDATGSMSDEIAQLQNNLLVISSQINALPGNIDTQYGLVTYRDRGDAYVSNVYNLTPNLPAFQIALNAVQAGGGGDYPESLNQALSDTLNQIQWRGGDTIKLVFLVADAPPHLDYPNDPPYTQSLELAAERGIKIHPIASSGLDQQGEFILRQIAQYTLGHFIFLTYEQGSGGAPGETRSDLSVGEPDDPADPQDEGDYTVEQLDELVLRLITDEIAALQTLLDGDAPVLVTTLPAVAVNQSGFMPTPRPSPMPVFDEGPDVETTTWPRLNLSIIVVLLGVMGIIAYMMARWWVSRNFPPPNPGFKRKNGEKRKLGDLEFLVIEDE